MTAREEAVFLFGEDVVAEAEATGAKSVAQSILEPVLWEEYRRGPRRLRSVPPIERPEVARTLSRPVAMALALAIMGEGWREVLLEVTATAKPEHLTKPRLKVIGKEDPPGE